MRPFYYIVWRLIRCIATIIFRLKIYNHENVPKTGPIIIASNHAAIVDPPFVSISIKRPIHFMAKKELFKNWLFGGIITALNAHPVDRGGSDRAAIRMTFNILKNDQPILIFPEGTRSDGINFLPARPGIGMIARRTMSPILPVYIHGSTRLKDCLKGRAKLAVVFGKPISVSEIEEYATNRDGYQKLADHIMNRIEELRSGLVN